MKYYKHKHSDLVIEVFEIKAYPQGGGQQLTLTDTEFERDFEPYEFPKRLVPGLAFIDDGPEYPCLLYPERWNGWRMPAFQFEVAQLIAERASTGSEFMVTYDPNRDAFVETQEAYPGEECVYASRIIDGVKYYPIGAGGWIWDGREL